MPQPKSMHGACLAKQKATNFVGEPWRAVSDIVGLHTAARHVAAIAKEVPYWDLDDLGRVLGIRDRISSGRSLGQSAHDELQKLKAALSEKAVVDEHTLRHAAYFYMEIGHFAGH